MTKEKDDHDKLDKESIDKKTTDKESVKESSTDKSKETASINDEESKSFLQTIAKYKYRIIFGTVIIIILLFSGYLMGVSHYSKDRQLDVLANDITSGSVNKMSSAVVASDKQPVSKAELQPLKKLLTKDQKTSGQIKTIIEHESSYSNFRVIQVGKYFGLYPKYKIELQKRNIVVETNIRKPIFKVEDKLSSSKKDGSEYYLKKSIPGSYSVNVSNQSGSYKKKQTVIVPVSGNCDEMDIDITMRRSPAI